ncbi:MAG: DMT family transporter [Alphaproteobacteria bacterium]|nr:DMT family transporter [Alphaproteobacteria bacterium]
MFITISKALMRPSILMVATTLSFVIADTQIKVIGASLPPAQIIGAIGVMSTLFLLALCAQQKLLSSIPQIFEPHVLARSVFDVAGSFFFVGALMYTPLGNLAAIMQSVPLVVTMLAILFLGEKGSPTRWLAILVGFAGVLLIVKPTLNNIAAYQVMALCTVLVVALRDLVTKRIPPTVPLPIITLSNSVFVSLAGWGYAFFEGAKAMEPWNIKLLIGAGLFITVGYLLIVSSVRLGELSATAPFRYSEVVFAVISSMLVFGEYPDILAYVGMALIIGAGLVTAWYETVKAHELEADMMPPVF